LSKDFVFSFRIVFGSGTPSKNNHPTFDFQIGSGVVFVLTRLSISETLIGGGGTNIGYGGLTYSIGVEFDTDNDGM